MDKTMTDKPAEAMSIIAAPSCGYYISNAVTRPGEYGMIVAAFSTLDEALRFVRDRMSPEVVGMTASQAREYASQGVSAGKNYI